MSNEDDGNKALGPSLIKSICDPHLFEMIQDFGEVAIDSLIKDDLLKEIPIIGTVIKSTKTGIAIKDRIFLNKMWRFIRELDNITAEEIDNLLNKIDEDESFQERVGETLILLLDRYDHLEKPKLLARLWRGYLRDEIDFEEFQRLATAVDRAFMPDLEKLLIYYSQETTPYQRGLSGKGGFWANLYYSGLSKIDPNVMVDREYGSIGLSSRYGKPEDMISYSPNKQAEIFARIVLGDENYLSFFTNKKVNSSTDVH